MAKEFTYVKRGYDPAEVDQYIRSMEQQLSEYMEKASAINKAIINAQVAADNIIKSAHTQAQRMLSDAESSSYTIKEKTINQIGTLKTNIHTQINLIENFQNDYKSLLERYLKPISSNEINPIIAKLNQLNGLIDELTNPVSTNKISESKPEEHQNLSENISESNVQRNYDYSSGINNSIEVEKDTVPEGNPIEELLYSNR